uniref:Uncharacterized protein n=1 Tax=Compsopogon caeruleus TaxID=31354 RepID=A0A7S1XHA6_9RHOD
MDLTLASPVEGGTDRVILETGTRESDPMMHWAGVSSETGRIVEGTGVEVLRHRRSKLALPERMWSHDDGKKILQILGQFRLQKKGVRDGTAAGLMAISAKARLLSVETEDSTLPRGWVYLELCPKYLSHSYQISYYAARKAWPLLQDLFGWRECSAAEARNFGASVRQLTFGAKYGRHLLIPRRNLEVICRWMEQSQDITSAVQVRAPLEMSEDREHVVNLRRLPSPGRSVSGTCPQRDQHRHGDRSPSLVLWINEDQCTGGAMCMVCQDPVHQHQRLTFAARFDGKRAYLKPPIDTIGNIRPRQRGKKRSPAPNRSPKTNSLRSDPTQPVGGCAMHPMDDNHHSYRHVGAVLRNQLYEDGPIRLRSTGHAVQGSPLDLLQKAERRSLTPSAARLAQATSSRVLVDGDSYDEASGNLPALLLSVSTMCPAGFKEVLGYRSSKVVAIPHSWEPAVQEWILLDLDDVNRLDLPGVVECAADKIIRIVRRDAELSGKVAVIQTGPSGLQVWAELRETRLTPRQWFRSPETLEWYLDLGRRVLRGVRSCGARRGILDESSCAPARFGRRPGWRLMKDGSLFRSRLVRFDDTRVAIRTPRCQTR